MNTNSIDTVANSKKYDIFDIKYTTELKSHFAMCNTEIKKTFNTFSTIMIQDVFSRNELLDITDSFETYIKKNENLFNIYEYINVWNSFKDKAFNFRPWQC